MGWFSHNLSRRILNESKLGALTTSSESSFHTGAARLVKKLARKSLFECVMNICFECLLFCLGTMSPLSSKFGKTSSSYNPLIILYSSIMSPLCRLYTRVGSLANATSLRIPDLSSQQSSLWLSSELLQLLQCPLPGTETIPGQQIQRGT